MPMTLESTLIPPQRSRDNSPAARLRLDPLDWKKIERQLQLAAEEKAASEQRPEQVLCCARCSKPITREDQRIAVQDRHEHVFLNPTGLIFRIGCFATAPGCVSIGPATLEHTWFPGYRWQIALCAGCGEHLGWRYRGDADSFYGLILKRLASAADGARPFYP